MTINTNIKISPGKSKMGAIPSVSLPAIKTCRDCKCKEKCYAAKLERLRPTVRNAYISITSRCSRAILRHSGVK